jgi:hypothetical protein
MNALPAALADMAGACEGWKVGDPYLRYPAATSVTGRSCLNERLGGGRRANVAADMLPSNSIQTQPPGQTPEFTLRMDAQWSLSRELLPPRGSLPLARESSQRGPTYYERRQVAL